MIWNRCAGRTPVIRWEDGSVPAEMDPIKKEKRTTNGKCDKTPADHP